MERIITPAELEEDSKGELSLRPQKISEYIGQDKVKERLDIFIKAAQKRRGVIIFTDPDFAGEKIRKKIAQEVPGCKHAFLPREEAKKDGDIGIENASPESI